MSDRKIGVYSNGSLTLPNDSVVAIVDYYEPHMINATDYYAFGMPSRVASSATGAGYRFGFNGKENDNEVKGYGNQLNFGDRAYDTRIGRWQSLDPIVKPGISPYQFGKNNPLNFLDPDGSDEIHFIIINNTTNNLRQLPASLRKPQMQIIVMPKEGPDRFFHHQVTKVMKEEVNIVRTGDHSFGDGTETQWVESKADIKTTEFFPDPVKPGYHWSNNTTGVTQEKFLGIPIDDNDFMSLMKLSTPELRKYLISKNSDRYGALEWFPTAYKVTNFISDWVVTGAVAKLAGSFFGALSREIPLGKYASMTNIEVRTWYVKQLNQLNTKVAFTEENARMLSAQRNALKAEARLMMKDRQAAAGLERTDPLRSFEYYVEKYKGEGYSGDALWEKIITGSAKPNAQVNSKFGIK